MDRTTPPLLLASLGSAGCPLGTGGAGWQALERWGPSQRAWLPTLLAVPQGIASQATWGRGGARLQPTRFQAGVLAWPQAGAPLPTGARVARAGHTVRASWARAPASSPWPRLAAWGAEQGGRVGGQSQTEAPSPAMTALPARRPL